MDPRQTRNCKIPGALRHHSRWPPNDIGQRNAKAPVLIGQAFDIGLRYRARH